MDLRSSKRGKNLKIKIPPSDKPQGVRSRLTSTDLEIPDSNLYDNESSPTFLSENNLLSTDKHSEDMNTADNPNAAKTRRTPPPTVNQPPLIGNDTNGVNKDMIPDPNATPPFKGTVAHAVSNNVTHTNSVTFNPTGKGYDGTGPGGSSDPATVEGVTDMDVDEDRQARERLHQEEQLKKLQILREEQQLYVMPGDHPVANDGSALATNGDETANNKVIAGHMLNYLDIQQKKNYDVFWNVNRIEMMHNAKFLRVTGHGIANVYDKEACYNWWLMVLDVLEAPRKYQELQQGVIHFATDSGDTRQGSDRGVRAPPRPNTTLFIEFPNAELPKWMLNSGVKSCRKLQSRRGMERLSFNPKLTTFEIKVQQYSLQVVQNIRENMNGPRNDRKDCLRTSVRVRGIGRLKEHVALLQNDGKEDKVYYNKLISDARTRPFLPMVAGQLVLPPTDFSIDPQNTSLMEIDYKAEAAGLGLEVVGKKKGVVMKVPEYVMPSLKKKLNTESNPSTGREGGGGWYKLSNSNGNKNAYGERKHNEGDYAWSTAKEAKPSATRSKLKDSRSNNKDKTYPSSWMKHKGGSSKKSSKNYSSSDSNDSSDDSVESGYQERTGSKRKNHKHSPGRNRNPIRKAGKDRERSKYSKGRSSGRKSERKRSRDRGSSRGRYRASKKNEDSSKSSDSSSSESSD